MWNCLISLILSLWAYSPLYKLMGKKLVGRVEELRQAELALNWIALSYSFCSTPYSRTDEWITKVCILCNLLADKTTLWVYIHFNSTQLFGWSHILRLDQYISGSTFLLNTQLHCMETVIHESKITAVEVMCRQIPPS